MDLNKLKLEDMRLFEIARMKEVEEDLRKAITMNRMDIYSEQNKKLPELKRLKRTLARLMTVMTEKTNKKVS